ncbi:MAG TPA: M1 family aminopeptidase, partial [Thermoanaerobaculia bacterium]|nr:M1 family aminopeptidase [Thermoanaerobaculia bacterium]
MPSACRFVRRLLPLLAFLPGLVPGALAAAPDPSYAALRAARPDGRTIPVHGLVLERDVFRFQFDSGAFHLLAPVGGRTVGAVFVGQGSYRLTPATEAERRHLGLVAGDDRLEILADNFEELVLLFGDDTAAELALHAPIQPMQKAEPDRRAAAAYESHLKRQKKDFHTNFDLRLLADLLNTPGLTSGVFLAFVDGRKYPPALAAVDPDGAEALRLAPMLGGEGSIFFVADPAKGGIWYLCHQAIEVKSGRFARAKRLADALHYTVDTSVARDADLAGTTTIRFDTLVPGLRLLPLTLMPKLRLQKAAFAMAPAPGAPGEPAWAGLAFVQENEKEDADAAVIFPAALPKGAKVLLRLSYKGDQVLQDAGDKNFVVGARESWYPNLGVFSDPASFDLTYRVPEGNEIISVGRQVEARVEGKESVSRWQTDGPVQVAGFNYGKFKKVDRRDETSGLDVAVYTNPGTPDIVRTINGILSGGGGGEIGEIANVDRSFASGPQGPSLGKVNTARLAESALADGLNAARLFTTYFGPLPEKQVAITQQSQWSFGQSWPSLIFLPYVAFLDGTQRQRLGLTRANDFVDEVGFHEFAHQWWGHLVGWDSYRDQWLSEGFAEFSAALAVQRTKGQKAYDDFWRNRRRTIVGKIPGAPANYEAGPITLGYRLSTARTPWAAQAIIYSKGAYVLHMLRMMMWEAGAPNPDD